MIAHSEYTQLALYINKYDNIVLQLYCRFKSRRSLQIDRIDHFNETGPIDYLVSKHGKIRLCSRAWRDIRAIGAADDS